MVKKKAARGRPKTGQGAQINVRCQPDFLKAVDKWRAGQLDKPSRPQAIIRLAAQALQAPGVAP
jgi:hypothetical protein